MSSVPFNFGQIITSDGSSMAPPDVDMSNIERTVVIPMDFAQGKVKEVATDLRELRQRYEKHVNQLAAYYTKSAEDARKHYETVFHDMKAKALRHVEIEKHGRRASEDKLNDEIKQKVTTIEALRDTLAANNLNYQQATRKLKEKHACALKELEEDLGRQFDTKDCISDLLRQVELCSEQASFEAFRVTSDQEMEALHRLYTAEISQICADFHEFKEEEKTNNVVARIVRVVVDDLGASVESAVVNEWNKNVSCLQANYKDILIARQSAENTRGVCSEVLVDLCAKIEASVCADLNLQIQRYQDLHESSTTHAGEEIGHYKRQIAELTSDLDLKTTENEATLMKMETLRAELSGKCDALETSLRAAEVAAVIEALIVACEHSASTRDLVATAEAAAAEVVLLKSAPVPGASVVPQEGEWGATDADEDAISAPIERSAITPKTAEVTPLARESSRMTAVAAAPSSNSEWVAEKGRLESKISQLELTISQIQGTPVSVVVAGTAPVQQDLPSDAELLAHCWVMRQSAALNDHEPAPLIFLPGASADTPTTDDGAALGQMRAALGSSAANLDLQVDNHNAKLNDFVGQFQDKTAEYELKSAEKSQAKAALKAWMRDFEAENGRQPDVDERAEMKHLFVAHKETSAVTKQLQEKLEDLMKHKDELQMGAEPVAAAAVNARAVLVKFDRLCVQLQLDVAGAEVAAPSDVMRSALPVPAGSSEGPQVVKTVEVVKPLADYATEDLIKTLKDRGEMPEPAPVVKKDASEEALDALEAQNYQLQVDIATANEAKMVANEEVAEVRVQMDALLKEKRTDVVLRFEKEIKDLTAKNAELNEFVLNMNTQKTKGDTKLAEYKERAEKAEAELKAKEEQAIKALAPHDEKAILTVKVQKQREEIVMKSKAATAGWDAAADADERAEKDIDAAFQRGKEEANKTRLADMAAINNAVEEKEIRITELVMELSQANKKVVELEIAVEDANAQAAQGGGGVMNMFDADTGEIGVSSEELNEVREELDAAQEEVVQLTDKLDAATAQLTVYEEKMQVYRDIIAELKAGGGGGAAVASSASGMLPTASTASLGGGGGGSAALTSCTAKIKKAISDGTGFWKAGKKDDCGDLYFNTATEVKGMVKCSELVDPLTKCLAAAQGLPRAKAAVALRKGLDKFLDDAKKPAIKAAEGAGGAVTGVGSSTLSVSMSKSAVGVSSDLQQKLAALDEQTTSITTKSADGGESANANLLKRAKKAEEQCEQLKKQMGQLMASIADGSVEQTAAPARPVRSKPAGGASAGATATGKPSAGPPAGVGANPVEFKKLQKRVKELEGQIAAAQSGGGGVDKKQLAQLDKKHEKKLKELDTEHKKAIKQLEAKAAKDAKANAEHTAVLSSTTTERDSLKKQCAEQSALLKEMDGLREKAEQIGVLKEAAKVKDAELLKLGDQYKKESTLRKKYKNELEDIKGAIRVYARCRPFAKYEIEKGCQSVVTFKDETACSIATSRGLKDFEFDAAFTADSTQDQVFEDTKRLVESCLDGFNVCVFAYGQTGSGKTHTMTGNPAMPGLTPKAIDELFRLVEEKTTCVCHVSTYFIELYNDNLVDLYWLLDKDNKRSKEGPPKLDIKMDAKKMVYIRNCVIKEVGAPSELMQLFHAGNAERHVGATMMNAESSRSHSIFAIMVECYDKTTKKTTMGKLSLVDLAGSERADKTGAAAERLKEAQNINKSLSALGDVISALSEGEKFIPYRNNKLTQVMQDSLGGNAKTLMFVNFSPADYNSDETVTSLNYASRVKKITNSAAKQAESEEVAKLKATIKKLMSGQQLAGADLNDLLGGDGGGDAGPEDEATQAARQKKREELTEGNGGGD